jgi:hypothetical protein
VDSRSWRSNRAAGSSLAWARSCSSCRGNWWARPRRAWQTFLYAVLYLLLLPAALLLAALDPLDRRRQFTHGYAALCRLERHAPASRVVEAAPHVAARQ